MGGHSGSDLRKAKNGESMAIIAVTYVARRVHPVHVSEPGSYREVWADLGETIVNIENVLWLSVERAVLDGF